MIFIRVESDQHQHTVCYKHKIQHGFIENGKNVA